MELDPLYIDTAIRRWQNLTGREARRASDKKSFREIEGEKEGNMKQALKISGTHLSVYEMRFGQRARPSRAPAQDAAVTITN